LLDRVEAASTAAPALREALGRWFGRSELMP
jgi:hypothetical protein